MAKYIGKGAKISFGDTASGTWTKIPQMETIGPLRSQSAQVNVTDLDSEEEEFIPGIKSPQTIACSVIWDPQNAVHQTVRDDAEAGVTLFFQIIWVDAELATLTTAVFQGSYADIEFGPTSNTEALKMPFSLQRSGGITWTDAVLRTPEEKVAARRQMMEGTGEPGESYGERTPRRGGFSRGREDVPAPLEPR